MKYVIVFALDGYQYALEKTDDPERARKLATLCEKYMHKMFPTAIVEVSYDRAFNMAVENHPDKIEIMGRLLDMELSAGRERVIEHA